MILIHCSTCIKWWRNWKNLERISEIKSFVAKYNWESKMFWKDDQKIKSNKNWHDNYS